MEETGWRKLEQLKFGIVTLFKNKNRRNEHLKFRRLVVCNDDMWWPSTSVPILYQILKSAFQNLAGEEMYIEIRNYVFGILFIFP